MGEAVNPLQVGALRWYGVNKQLHEVYPGAGGTAGSFTGIAFDGSSVFVADRSVTNGNGLRQLRSGDGWLVNMIGTSGSAPFSAPLGVVCDGTYVWVANSTGGSVHRHKPARNEGTNNNDAVATVGTTPWGVAFDGASVWVTNSGSNNVHKLTTQADGTILREGPFPTGSNPLSTPKGIAYSANPDGSNGQIWVTNAGGTTVTALNPATGSVVGTYSVGSSPEAVAFDGTNIWVANAGGTTVTVLNTAGALVNTVPVGSQPRGLAFDGNFMWVANYGSSTLSKVDVNTFTVVGSYSVPSAPLGLAFDGISIWVTSDAGHVYKR